VSVPDASFPEEKQKQFYDRLLGDVAARPVVASAAAVFPLPLGGGRIGTCFQIDGHTVPEDDEPPTEFRQVSPGYFSAMHIPLLQGRDFDKRDSGGAVPVVIVNRSLANRFFPNGDAIGKRIKPGISRNGPSVFREIVGVVGDVKSTSLTDEVRNEVYVPYGQIYVADMSVVVRTSSPAAAEALEASLKDVVGSISAEVPVFGVRDLDRLLGFAVAQPRFNAFLLGVFAAVALVLTAVGLYGVMAYAVERRTHEIGIRMALGADRPAVLRMVVGRGLFLASAGLAIGLVGALAATRLMTGLLFEIQPSDPATFAATALLLATVSVLASWLPARRATRIEPMSALRYE
jgi:putative ABC transport system permease protein